MVPTGHRLNACIIVDHIDLSLIRVGKRVGRLDRQIDLLSPVYHNLLALDLKQIVCWDEAAVRLLDDAAEYIRGVKVDLVALL